MLSWPQFLHLYAHFLDFCILCRLIFPARRSCRNISASQSERFESWGGGWVWNRSLAVCACVELTKASHGPSCNFISFPAGWKIVVIYMAQVQPDSNMSDICYYSEISFFLLVLLNGRCPCTLGWGGSLVDRPPCCIQVDPEKQQFLWLYPQTDESGDA